MLRLSSSAIAFAWCCLSSSLVQALPATEIASRVQPPLTPIYEARQFTPLWLDESGKPSTRAAQAIQIMTNAADDGLHPAAYGLAALQQQHDELMSHGGNDLTLATFDLALSRAMASYLEDLSVGQVAPNKLGFAINVSARQTKFQNSLAELLSSKELDNAVNKARPVLPTYAVLKEQLAIYRALAMKHPEAPELPALPAKKLSPGETWEGTPALADWLVTLGYMPAGRPVTNQYTGEVVTAVENFQHHHGQIADGVIGKQTYQNLKISLPSRVQQIELAMERLRWLDDSIMNNRFIVINVPQFTLWAFAPDAAGKPEPKLRMAVVVGQAGKTETPLMTKNLSSMVFSPYWNVPRSIAVKELLPKLHHDPGYLTHENMELVDSNGNAHGSQVGPEELRGIASGQFRIRQRPGLKNALGELKFVFPNDDSIYMHDTPSKSYFAKERRDLSHGCVRLQNPMGLALFALETQGEWSEEKIREKISNSHDQHLSLKERMPVLLIYLTANVNENGNMVFLPDIYQQDAKLLAAMKEQRT